MANKRTLYEGEFLRLNRVDHWEYTERANARGAVIVVAVTDDDELLLVEQPRIPLQQSVIELPAGLVGDIVGEEDEQLAVAAARELEEETGYRAQRFEYLTAGPPSAGMANEIISFYRAFELTRVHAGGGDDSEQIIPHAIPLDAVESWLAARQDEGLLVDPKVYTGLYFILRQRWANAGSA